MFNFKFNSISDAIFMQSSNGQYHGLYVWSVVLIVLLSILITFLVYKVQIKNIGKKIK